MTDQSNKLLKQALQLSSLEKAQIIEALLASLDHPDATIDRVWAQESDARIQAFENGEISAKPAKDVLSKYSHS